MEITLSYSQFALLFALLAALQSAVQFVVAAYIKASIEHSVGAKFEKEKKIREEAEKVAEYLALARGLKEDSTEEQYLRANQLSWELAMWLPEDVYKKMTQSIRSPSFNTNPLTTVIQVRKLLLGNDAESLNADEVAHHAPGVGRPTQNNPP